MWGYSVYSTVMTQAIVTRTDRDREVMSTGEGVAKSPLADCDIPAWQTPTHHPSQGRSRETLLFLWLSGTFTRAQCRRWHSVSHSFVILINQPTSGFLLTKITLVIHYQWNLSGCSDRIWIMGSKSCRTAFLLVFAAAFAVSVSGQSPFPKCTATDYYPSKPNVTFQRCLAANVATCCTDCRDMYYMLREITVNGTTLLNNVSPGLGAVLGGKQLSVSYLVIYTSVGMSIGISILQSETWWWIFCLMDWSFSVFFRFVPYWVVTWTARCTWSRFCVHLDATRVSENRRLSWRTPSS